MAYTRINFVDDETPLNESYMNRMDLQIYNNESYTNMIYNLLNTHETAITPVHTFKNVSTSLYNNSVVDSSNYPTLEDEILFIRLQLAKLHGCDTWNDSSWWNKNITSLNARINTISWNGSVNESQYLIGGPVTDNALYEFNSTVTLIDARFIMNFYNKTGSINLHFNQSSGTMGNWSIVPGTYPNASYYRGSYSLNNSIINYSTDGFGVQATNVSGLTELYLTINYRE